MSLFISLETCGLNAIISSASTILTLAKFDFQRYRAYIQTNQANRINKTLFRFRLDMNQFVQGHSFPSIDSKKTMPPSFLKNQSLQF